MAKITHYINEIQALLRVAGHEWSKIDPFRDAAVISYYTIFSMPGLFIILINVFGYFYGTEAVTHQLSNQIASFVGTEVSQQVETIIGSVHLQNGFLWSSLVSIAVLVFAATGAFYHLQQSLNAIWDIEETSEHKILEYLKDRFYSFVMIILIGLLMFVSIIISSILTTVIQTVGTHFARATQTLLNIGGVAIIFAISTILFALIFRILPDVEIKWKYVWPGALLTSLFFIVAKYLLDIYLAYSDPGSAYGAAGSIIIIMLWVTYSSTVLLFGAAFTKAYTQRYQSKE